VAVSRCGSYELSAVKAALRELLDNCGGVEAIFGGARSIALKVNLLSRTPPERAATTHPAIVTAFAQIICESGRRPIVIESPPGPYNAAVLRSFYSRCGIEEAAGAGGADLSYDTTVTRVSCPDGAASKSYNLIGAALNADAIVSLARLKTHAFMAMTGAVKNMFGCVPGMEKVEAHAHFADAALFGEQLVDICECVKPVFSVVDAVTAMEGEGPQSGVPRDVGLILGGRSPYNVDLAAAGLIGLKPSRVPAVAAAARRGLCPETVGRLDIRGLGGPFGDVAVRDFRKASSTGMLARFGGMFGGRLVRALTPRPVVKPSACAGCGICAEHCPAQTIEMRGKAKIVHKKCISCFCCHELCPHKAINIHRNMIFKVLK